MVTDRVGDFIIRLQNAALIGKKHVSVRHSTILSSIAKKLKELGFLSFIEIKERDGSTKKTLVATITYDEHNTARLRGVKRISSPGRRLYISYAAAHKVKGGTGARVISSSIGIISDAEARQKKIGGEELFQIW